MVVQGMAAAPDFRVGQVLTRSLTVWFQNLVPFGILGVVFNIPLALFAYTAVQEILLAQGQLAPGELPQGVAWKIFAAVFVSIVCYQLLTAAVAYGVIKRLRGQPVQIGACFAQAFKRFIPVMFTGLLGAILTWLAGLLLVIPGIIVMLNFWVAVPVCVVEELGASASLSRAKSLARGHRWKILGILLVAAVIVVVIQQILGFVIGLVTPSRSLMTAVVPMGVGLLVINQALFTTLTAAVATCVYYYLRVVKEGADIDQIAAVFD